MMLEFRDKRQKTRERNRNKAIALVVAIVLSTLALGFTFTGKLFTYIGLPLWKSKNALSKAAEVSSVAIRTKESVFAENRELLRENDTLKLSMIDYQVLQKENDELKKILGRIPKDVKLALANILAKPNISPYDTLLVDAGSDNGVALGARVYADGNVPLGQISKVYSDTSVVTLYSSPTESTIAILDGSNASIELVGRGGGNFEITLPLDQDSYPGTLVLLPGARSLVVAIVTEVISTPTDPYKKVILRSPVNVQNLKWVQVEKR